jgi:hypothetical protein
VVNCDCHLFDRLGDCGDSHGLGAVKLVGVDRERAGGALVKRASVVRPLGINVVTRFTAHLAGGVGRALILSVGKVVGRGIEAIDDGLSFGLSGKGGCVDCIGHILVGLLLSRCLRCPKVTDCFTRASSFCVFFSLFLFSAP